MQNEGERLQGGTRYDFMGEDGGRGAVDDGVHGVGADPVDGAAHGGQPLGQVAEHIDGRRTP